MKDSMSPTTKELVAQVLGKQAAQRLAALKNMNALLGATVAELTQTYGLSDRAAHRAVALSRLVRRIDGDPKKLGDCLGRSADIAAHAKALGMADLAVEHFRVLLLNAKNRLLGDFLCSQGILTASLVHPREVFSPAIRACAAGLVVIHNHPSGDPEPSPEDREVTKRLRAVGELVGIPVLDHVVVAITGYVSFLERGWL